MRMTHIKIPGKGNDRVEATDRGSHSVRHGGNFSTLKDGLTVGRPGHYRPSCDYFA